LAGSTRAEPFEEAAILTVGDDRISLPNDVEGDGFGLRSVRKRAAQLGGEVGLTARVEWGTQLAFRLPIMGAASAIMKNHHYDN